MSKNTLEHRMKYREALQKARRVEIEESKEAHAAFVSFKSRLGAAVALHIQQGVNRTEWVTDQAPEPQDVHWAFFSASYIKRWIGKLVVFIACTALTILFLIPVVIVQGLTHLDQLEYWFPFLKGILTLTFVSEVITGYLPSLILQMFLSFVPPIMINFSSMQGNISISQIEKSACIKMLWFTIWNIFFANVLAGSALYQVNIFLEPKKIPSVLAAAVPGQCLVKKDREGVNDRTTAEFYDSLATAYKDPALTSRQYTGSTDGHSSPLLHAAEV